MSEINKSEIQYLLSSRAVRERCLQLFNQVKEGKSDFFLFNQEKVQETAHYVADVTIANYPDLEIPYHSRRQHFLAGNIDRISKLKSELDLDNTNWIKTQIELVITSVLLDAGAGPDWQFTEPTTKICLGRSEGLALASYQMFSSSGFSSTNQASADAKGLMGVTTETIAKFFQVGKDNPMAGLEGRAKLIQKLGHQIISKPEFFGEENPRLGNILDPITQQSSAGKLKADKILEIILQALGDIWPSRLSLHGTALGDCWKHPQVKGDGQTDKMVPFHKLSQWLSYSLLEPLEETGLEIIELDLLTGLPEYRNGGLLLDLGTISLKDPALAKETHAADSLIIVEWRALTVCLLDEIAKEVRKILSVSSEQFPLAKVLQGGTWSAGRKIAAHMRSDRSPPLRLSSDGTVF